MKKIIIPSVLVFVAVVTAIVVFAINSNDKYRLIKIKSFEGEVVVDRDGEDTDAFDGMNLIPDDKVEVKKNSFLELLCDSDKHICAEENTSFVIDSNGNEKDGYITIELLYGKALFTIDNKLPEDSSFDVKTPNATLSVRGTEFSVEYNPQTKETTVEVFEGKVWAAYNGREETLQKGDVRIIGTLTPTITPSDDNDQPQSPDDDNENPVNGENENTYNASFIVERIFSNTPDYDTAPPSYITMTYLEAEGVALEGDYTNPPLESYIQEIEEKYIQNLMPKTIILFEDTKQRLIEYGKDGIVQSPIGIGKWLEDFEVQQIVLVDRGGNYYKFKPEDVYIEWIINQSETDVWDNYITYYPMGYGGEVGAPYRITGMKYHFFGTAEKYE
ncbi:MAG: FecR domain-containing protein [Lachnospiraceae bacterium]